MDVDEPAAGGNDIQNLLARIKARQAQRAEQRVNMTPTGNKKVDEAVDISSAEPARKKPSTTVRLCLYLFFSVFGGSLSAISAKLCLAKSENIDTAYSWLVSRQLTSTGSNF